jgi:cysteine desulfurase
MIYLDNNATTQPTARVVEAMLPYLSECYFNASASTAAFTGADKPRCEAAAAMAKLLNAEEPDSFTFTSGATESNNWVFWSFARGRKAGRVLVSAIEHASVAEPAAELARAGFDVVEVAVNAQGVVRLDALHDALREDTALVSIMAANNETGVLEPIAKIGRLICERCPAALFQQMPPRQSVRFQSISKASGRMWTCSRFLPTSFTVQKESAASASAQGSSLNRCF